MCLVEDGRDVLAPERLDAHARPWHLVPHLVDGLAEPRPGSAAQDEDVSVCRGTGYLPSALEHGVLGHHARACPSGHFDQQGVRVPRSDS